MPPVLAISPHVERYHSGLLERVPVCCLHCLPRVCGGLIRNLHRAIVCRGFLFVCHVALKQSLGLEGLAR